MTAPERWERLKALFHGALEQPRTEREQWLREAAGGDLDLLHEAQALVDAHQSAGTFLEAPPAVDPDDLLDDAPVRGDTLGPYTIVSEIGRGGMGVVYLAEDRRLGRQVALKALPPAAAHEPVFRERLRREARAAATITHANVAIVYALEELDGRLFIVSEYVRGGPLRAEIARGPLPEQRGLAIAASIARALVAAHDAGVIHRDLKPENVILQRGARETDPDTVKVVDFGIASVEGAAMTRLTRDGTLIGTPAYMAPEQLAGAPVDARADIYAAGVVLAEMVTGHHPLHAAGRATLPATVAPIVARCLQQNPDARFSSARELLGAIEEAAAASFRLKAEATGEARLKAEATKDSSAVAGPLELTDPLPVASAFRRKESSLMDRPRWWWEFHQAMAALTYWLMVIPAWSARALIGGAAGRAFFIVVLAAVIVAANLRLHLWFTSHFYPRELKWLRARIGRWIQAADWLFALSLVAGALLIGIDESPIAILLLAFGLGAAVAFVVIEPATARAAFRRADPVTAGTDSRAQETDKTPSSR
jgi:hypothetical protein